jgi:hypothetical protein
MKATFDAAEDKVQSDGPDDSCILTTYPGASAIFKILQTRPVIFEKRLQRPRAASIVARQEPPTEDSAATGHRDAQHAPVAAAAGENGGGGDGGGGGESNNPSSPQHRGVAAASTYTINIRQ